MTLPRYRLAIPPSPDREIVRWRCPVCRYVYAVYKGEEPRHWWRREDGTLICPACHRKALRESRKPRNE